MSRTATGPSKHLASLDDWIAAFMVLMAVYAEKDVNQLPHMLEYIQSIRELSQNFGLAAACAYDEQFRRNRQTNLMPWSQIDPNLWLRVSSIHLATSQVRRAAPYHTQSPRNNDRNYNTLQVPQGYCFSYHRRGECGQVKCTYLHNCFRCHAAHPAGDCRTNRANNARPDNNDKGTKSDRPQRGQNNARGSGHPAHRKH